MLLWMIYVMELLRFLLFAGGILGTKIRRYWLAAGSCVVYAVVILLWSEQVQNLPLKFSVVIPAMVISCFMQEDKWLKRIAQVVLIDVILNSIAELVKLFVKKILEIVLSTARLEWWWELVAYLLTSVVILISVLIVLLFKSKYKKWKIRHISATWICILFSFVMFILSLVSSSVRFMAGFTDRKDLVLISNIIAGAALAGLMVLVFVFVYIFFMEERLKQLYDSEKMLKESQKIYYETLLDKEEDTRRFRHDMANHLLYMQQLAKECKNDDLIQYVKSINHKLTEIQQRAFITGDEILDTMLNYYVKQLNNPVDIHIFGKIEAEITVDSMDLCTIFSNVVKNAVEELNCQCAQNLIFYLHIFTGNNNVKIEFENTSREKTIINGQIETTKQDKKNHGIGLQNIKEVVECYNGLCNLEYQEGIFRTIIYLPISQENNE